jgi:hypothetical protein
MEFFEGIEGWRNIPISLKITDSGFYRNGVPWNVGQAIHAVTGTRLWALYRIAALSSAGIGSYRSRLPFLWGVVCFCCGGVASCFFACGLAHEPNATEQQPFFSVHQT